MGRVNEYRKAVEEILLGYTALPYEKDTIRNRLFFDQNTDSFLLLAMGWEGYRRIHHCFVHIELIEDKVWIHFDGTEIGIAKELVDKGIPKEHIVLAFQSPERRQYSGYAVA
jgi:XisI protein